MTSQQTKEIKRVKKPFLQRTIGRFLLILGALTLAGVLYVANWMSYSEYPSDLVEKARSFKVPEGWKEVRFNVENRRNGCIDVECPSVALIYESDGDPLNRDHFINLVRSANSGFVISDDNCTKFDSGRYSCQSEIVEGDMQYTVSSLRLNKNEKSKVYIYVRELKRDNN